MKYLIKITGGLDKEFLIYFYTIYTRESWSVLVINNPTLKYICCLWVYYAITTRQICLWYHYSTFFYFFQTYNIISCDKSCDHNDMPLHCPKKNKKKRKLKKKKIKSRKINKKKKKSKWIVSVQVHHDTVPLIRTNPDRRFINLLQSNIFKKLGSNRKLTLKEQNRCFNNKSVHVLWREELLVTNSRP